jgi:hypothetical protein
LSLVPGILLEIVASQITRQKKYGHKSDALPIKWFGDNCVPPSFPEKRMHACKLSSSVSAQARHALYLPCNMTTRKTASIVYSEFQIYIYRCVCIHIYIWYAGDMVVYVHTYYTLLSISDHSFRWLIRQDSPPCVS